MSLFGTKKRTKKIELEPRLQKILNEGKCLKFTEKLMGKGQWCLINFAKNNYWMKPDYMNYKIPLKISEIKDYTFIMIGKYPIKYMQCDSYIGSELPTDESEYCHIKLKITINEHDGFEYYTMMEFIGRGEYAKIWRACVHVYKMPSASENKIITKISYV